jgi:hypothetical protein
MQTLADKRHAVELLNQLDSSQLAAVVQLLEVMVPHDEDGDTLSPAERKAIAEADEWLKQNEPIPHEQVLAEFGLTMEDWEKMSEEPLPEEAPRRNG